jgi:hypothetical protein
MSLLTSFYVSHAVGQRSAHIGASRKPLQLWSNAKWVEELYRALPPNFKASATNVAKTYYKAGVRQVDGGSQLKQTQVPQLVKCIDYIRVIAKRFVLKVSTYLHTNVASVHNSTPRQTCVV